MTDKRFVKTHKTINWWAVLDNDKELFEDEVVELLNALNEENEELKQRLESKEKAHTRCDGLYWKLYDEKEQLKKRLDEVLKELYCKDRRLEELGEDIECCDKQ